MRIIRRVLRCVAGHRLRVYPRFAKKPWRPTRGRVYARAGEASNCRETLVISDEEARAAVEHLLNGLTRTQLRLTITEEGEAFSKLLGVLPPGISERGPIKVASLGAKVAAWLHEPDVPHETRRALAELLAKLGYEGS